MDRVMPGRAHCTGDTRRKLCINKELHVALSGGSWTTRLSLGINSPESLRRWVVRARIDRGLVQGPTTVELAEIKTLRKEVADKRWTIEILKAAT